MTQHVMGITGMEIQAALDNEKHGPLEVMFLELLAGVATREQRKSVVMRIDFPPNGKVVMELRVRKLGVFEKLLWALMRRPVPMWVRYEDGERMV